MALRRALNACAREANQEAFEGVLQEIAVQNDLGPKPGATGTSTLAPGKNPLRGLPDVAKMSAIQAAYHARVLRETTEELWQKLAEDDK